MVGKSSENITKKHCNFVSRDVTRDGKTVTIQATREIGFGWSLLVAGDNGYCSHWTDFFHTAEKAIDEAIKAIDEEGIDEFYANPFGEAYLFDLQSPK